MNNLTQQWKPKDADHKTALGSHLEKILSASIITRKNFKSSIMASSFLYWISYTVDSVVVHIPIYCIEIRRHCISVPVSCFKSIHFDLSEER